MGRESVQGPQTQLETGTREQPSPAIFLRNVNLLSPALRQRVLTEASNKKDGTVTKYELLLHSFKKCVFTCSGIIYNLILRKQLVKENVTKLK